MDETATRVLHMTAGKRTAGFIGLSVLAMAGLVFWGMTLPSCPPGDDGLAACEGPAWKSIAALAAQGIAWLALLGAGLLATGMLGLATGGSPDNLKAFYGWAIPVQSLVAGFATFMTILNGGAGAWAGFIINFFAPVFAMCYVIYSIARLVGLQRHPSPTTA